MNSTLPINPTTATITTPSITTPTDTTTGIITTTTSAETDGINSFIVGMIVLGIVIFLLMVIILLTITITAIMCRRSRRRGKRSLDAEKNSEENTPPITYKKRKESKEEEISAAIESRRGEGRTTAFVHDISDASYEDIDAMVRRDTRNYVYSLNDIQPGTEEREEEVVVKVDFGSQQAKSGLYVKDKEVPSYVNNVGAFGEKIKGAEGSEAARRRRGAEGSEAARRRRGDEEKKGVNLKSPIQNHKDRKNSQEYENDLESFGRQLKGLRNNDNDNDDDDEEIKPAHPSRQDGVSYVNDLDQIRAELSKATKNSSAEAAAARKLIRDAERGGVSKTAPWHTETGISNSKRAATVLGGNNQEDEEDREGYMVYDPKKEERSDGYVIFGTKGNVGDVGDEDEEGYVPYDPKEDNDIEGVYGEVEIDSLYVNENFTGVVDPVVGRGKVKGEGEELNNDAKKGLYMNDLNSFAEELKEKMEAEENVPEKNKKHNPYVNDIFKLVEEVQRKEGVVGGGVPTIEEYPSASSYGSRYHGNDLASLLPT